MSKHGISVVCTVWIIVSVFVLLRLLCPVDQCTFPRQHVSLSTFLQQAQTGDILAVSYRTFPGQLIRVFTRSVWSHVALVIRQGDKLYAVEMYRYEQQQHQPKTDTLSDVHIVPIQEWLQYNKHRPMAWSRHQGPPIPSNRLLQVIHRLQQPPIQAKIDMIAFHWIDALRADKQRQPLYCAKALSRRNKSTNNSPCSGYRWNKFYCSELIAFLLQEMNVIGKTTLPGAYSPGAILLGQLPFHPSHSLREPVWIKQTLGLV